MLVEAFVAKFAVEALDESDLHQLARLDVVPVETTGGPAKTAQLVSSVPLSLTITLGVLHSNPAAGVRAPLVLRRKKYRPPWLGIRG